MNAAADIAALTVGGIGFGWVVCDLLMHPLNPLERWRRHRSVARRATQPTPDGQADGGES